MAYVLHYFTIRGLAEPIRMLLVDNGIKFDDVHYSKDTWPEKKAHFTFGQVPCLKEGDVEIVQSGAILRHLGRKHNLDGETEMDKTYVDLFAEGIKDMHMKYTKMIYQEYEKKDEFLATTYPTEWARIEKLFKSKANGEKFVAGDKLTYADYVLFEELDIALILSKTALDAFPTLKAFHSRFAARPNLKDYIASRKLPVNNNGKQ